MGGPGMGGGGGAPFMPGPGMGGGAWEEWEWAEAGIRGQGWGVRVCQGLGCQEPPALAPPSDSAERAPGPPPARTSTDASYLDCLSRGHTRGGTPYSRRRPWPRCRPGSSFPLMPTRPLHSQGQVPAVCRRPGQPQACPGEVGELPAQGG